MKIEDIKPSHLPEYDRHERVVRLENESLGVTGFIAVHRVRGAHPSLGATRLWTYAAENDALRDALRLARLMSHKSAFADLPYGGGKAAIIIKTNTAFNRSDLFSWYAEAVNELNGMFVTGSDVGVSPEDVTTMRKHSAFIIGDGVSAEYYTAVGVMRGINAVLESVYGSPDARGKRFAIQGLGKTGFELMKLLYPEAAEIFVSDIDQERLENIKKEYPNIKMVAPSEIHRQEADIFSPCALQHSISSKTIPELLCRGIVGSANNQLEKSSISDELQKRGIIYAPDYVVNNGGLVSVADQYSNGTHDDARIMESISRTYQKLRKVLSASSMTGLSPAVVADRHVDSLII